VHVSLGLWRPLGDIDLARSTTDEPIGAVLGILHEWFCTSEGVLYGFCVVAAMRLKKSVGLKKESVLL
jgi:hypothetical protein